MIACEEKTAAVLADEKPLSVSTLAVPTGESPPKRARGANTIENEDRSGSGSGWWGGTGGRSIKRGGSWAHLRIIPSNRKVTLLIISLDKTLSESTVMIVLLPSAQSLVVMRACSMVALAPRGDPKLTEISRRSASPAEV